MNWTAFVLINLTWAVCLLLIRRRYRRLLGEAIGLLDTIHASLTPHVERERQLRAAVGKLLSDLIVDTRIEPGKR